MVGLSVLTNFLIFMALQILNGYKSFHFILKVPLHGTNGWKQTTYSLIGLISNKNSCYVLVIQFTKIIRIHCPSLPKQPQWLNLRLSLRISWTRLQVFLSLSWFLSSLQVIEQTYVGNFFISYSTSLMEGFALDRLYEARVDDTKVNIYPTYKCNPRALQVLMFPLHPNLLVILQRQSSLSLRVVILCLMVYQLLHLPCLPYCLLLL